MRTGWEGFWGPCAKGPTCPTCADREAELIDMRTMTAMATKKKASGRNIPEAERETVQVKLRLPEDVRDDLDELARRWKLTRSGTVARLLEMATDVQGDPK